MLQALKHDNERLVGLTPGPYESKILPNESNRDAILDDRLLGQSAVCLPSRNGDEVKMKLGQLKITIKYLLNQKCLKIIETKMILVIHGLGIQVSIVIGLRS